MNIFLAIPNKGQIDTVLQERTLQWTVRYTDSDIYLSMHRPQGLTPYQFARDKCVAEMINREREYDYLVFIDADVRPPVDLIDRLVEHDKDIVGAAVPQFKRNHEGKTIPMPMAFKRMNNSNELKKVTEDPMRLVNDSGLKEVDAIGTGATAIKTKVIHDMEPPWFKPEYEYSQPTLGQWQVDKRGEDLNFCLKAKELGYSAWIDFDLIPGHISDIDINTIRDSMNYYVRKAQEEDEGE